MNPSKPPVNNHKHKHDHTHNHQHDHDHVHGHDSGNSHSHIFKFRVLEKRKLILSLTITAVVMIIELIGGFITNSIALISDAGHMFTHCFAIGIGLGAIIGLILGLGLSFLFEYFDKTIKTPEDVEGYLGLPVLGTIPKIDKDYGKGYGRTSSLSSKKKRYALGAGK